MHSNLDSYPHIMTLLDELRTNIQAILKDKLVGFYLYGSLVWGDFDEAHSDLDLLAALTADLSDAEAFAIGEMHATFAQYHPEWHDRIEVQYLSLQGLKTFRTETHRMGNISPGEPFHMIEADRAWLMNWYFVQNYGVTLFGPPPQVILDPISPPEFIAAVREHVDMWREYILAAQEQPPYRSYAILTMCRALYTHQTGEQVSKKQAVAWAIQAFPQWVQLIQRAWAGRSHSTSVDLSYDEAAAFVAFARSQILT
ncbi:MAG: hypothetical protein OHK0023_08830 [Anaerolineae bacterium]